MNLRLSFALGFLAGCSAVRLYSQPIILSPDEAAKQGPPLAQDVILALNPNTNITKTGVLKIRDAKGKRSEIPVRFDTTVRPGDWTASYATTSQTNGGVTVVVTHRDTGPNVYLLREGGTQKELSGNETMIPFAGGDFWISDLGLEFLHWPRQRLLRKELRRGQSCAVLESTNPHPAPGAYSRVVSWIDIDTDGIMNAEAYDSKGKVLKEFAIKSIKKVQGQPELKEMEMDNRQTGSRTWIEFDLSSGK